MIDIETIPATEVHHDFIYATWLKSFRYASYFAKRIKNDVYFKGQHKRVTEVMNAPTTKVLVAIEPPDQEFMVGYLVYSEPMTIQYLYVKDNLRKLKVATTLIKESGLDLNKAQFTHWTYDCDWMMGKNGSEPKYPGLIYNPYA